MIKLLQRTTLMVLALSALVGVDSLARGAQAQAQSPPRSGSPADNLPPNITRLTIRGEKDG